jgi:putative flavoprotein involved in K+ transport
MPPLDPASLPGRSVPVVVIGGGQAGLAMSWLLTDRGIEHVVLERARVGAEWRDRRWDSFSLVTPNWQCQLPGWPYRGDDPDGFMVRDEIVAYLEGYAASFEAPLVEGVAATGLRRATDGFTIDLPDGSLDAEAVVLATGPYQQPRIPRLAERLPASIVQLHSSAYRNPEQLPDGEVLVVGSGQSGAQVAEDLHLAGRAVHLATGTSPRCSRVYRGRDVVAWLHDMGYYDLPVEEHPLGEGARRQTNHYVTGRDGGHDLDLRAFAREGMRLHGRLLGLGAGDADAATAAGTLTFADDLATNLDHADEVLNGINASIDKHIAGRGIDAPPGGVYEPVWRPGPAEGTSLDLGEVRSIVWALGYDRSYPWIQVPIFDGRGYPTHTRGVTREPGLFVLGLPWLHTWGSGRFSGVARDAEFLADRIGTHLAVPARPAA